VVSEEGAGSCEKVSTSCESVVDKRKCGTANGAVAVNGTVLSCFWLYNETNGNDGNCLEKNNTELNCTVVKHEPQCNNDALAETYLVNKCKIDNNVCVPKCDYISEQSVCESRVDECFWLMGRRSSENDRCVEEV
jgi:hypothetical protein